MANQIRSPLGAFKEEHEMYPDIKEFTHSLSLEILATVLEDGKTKTNNVPQKLALTFTNFLSTDKTTTIETITKQAIGSTDDILQSKEEFDQQFKCEVRTVSDIDYIKTYFIIRTTRTFGKIKDDSWRFLKRNSMWLRKAPGPPGTTNMQALGMLTNVPQFASLVSVK